MRCDEKKRRKEMKRNEKEMRKKWERKKRKEKKKRIKKKRKMAIKMFWLRLERTSRTGPALSIVCSTPQPWLPFCDNAVKWWSRKLVDSVFPEPDSPKQTNKSYSFNSIQFSQIIFFRNSITKSSFKGEMVWMFWKHFYVQLMLEP